MLRCRSTIAAWALAPLLATLGVPRPALGATQLVLGKRFMLADPRPGGDPTLRRGTLLARETNSSATVVGDPVTNGASITIVANGRVPSSQTLLLPNDSWRATSTGFRYDDRRAVHGPVQMVDVHRNSRGSFEIAVRITSPQGVFSVVPPDPGTDGGFSLTLTTGGIGDTYCVAFGGAAGGAVTNNGTKLFKVTKPTATAGCPSLPTTTTTSTTTTSTTTTTILPPACGSFSGSPLCWGECPPETPICADLGGVCGCVAGTEACGGSAGAPLCDGVCPSGETCVSGGFDCACMPVTTTPCFGAGGPTCGGFCPTDEQCLFLQLTTFSGCACIPPSCQQQTGCGGTCPSGRSCQTRFIPEVGTACLCLLP